jgi:PAS domain S-box-containing protein
MEDEEKTKEQLISELTILRQRVSELEQDGFEHNLMEEALRKSEVEYHNISEHAPVGIFRSTIRGKLIEVNPEAARILGYDSPEEIIAVTNRTSTAETIYVDPESRQEIVKRALENSSAWVEAEGHLRRKSGETIVVRFFFRKIPMESRESDLLEGFMEDITGRKLAEEALRASETTYRIVADNTYDWEYWVSPAGQFLYTSPSCQRITGYAANEFETDSELISRIIHPDDRPKLADHFQPHKNIEMPCRLEFRIIQREGSMRWIGHVCQPVFDAEGRFLGHRGSNRDITDRKRGEEALQASEQRYKQLLSSVTDYIFTIDMKYGLPVSTTHGQGCVAVTGFTPEDYARMPYLWYEMVHPEDQHIVKQYAETAMRGEARDPLEHRIIHRTGTTRWVRNTMVPRYDTSGRIVACDGLISDITDRKNVEYELKQTNTYLENIFENSPDAIGIVDGSGRFIRWNRMAAELYGYTFEEMKGKSGFDLYADKDELERMLMHLRQEGSVKKCEMRMKRKEGSIVPFEISIGLLKDSQNKTLGSVCVARDLSGIKEALLALKTSNEQLYQEITERRRAEESLLKSEETLQESERNLRSLASELFTIQEAERKRISKELHDGLGQELTVLKISLTSLQDKLRKDQISLKGECDFLLSCIDGIIEDTRRLCHDLSPYLLEELGLLPSLEHMFAEVCQRNNIICSFEMEPIDYPLSRGTMVSIYRIFQEALTNIVKHSGATRVSLFVERQPEKLIFMVADNGKGFDIQLVNQRPVSKRGMGLFAMAERTQMLGGSFQILGWKGEGTKISFSFPLKEKGTE